MKKQPKKSALEFEDNSAPQADKEVGGVSKRDAFRLPFAAMEEVTVKLNGQTYEVVDICRDGVGLRLAKDAAFPEAGEKVKIIVTLDGESHNIVGRIIHISPDFFDQYLCGIQFVDLKVGFKKNLTSLLKKRRTDWFSE